jgi:hypothetical protein
MPASSSTNVRAAARFYVQRQATVACSAPTGQSHVLRSNLIASAMAGAAAAEPTPRVAYNPAHDPKITATRGASAISPN